MRTQAWLLSLSLCVVLACKKDTEPPPTSTNETAAAPAAAAKAKAPAPDHKDPAKDPHGTKAIDGSLLGVVQLVKPGVEPRKELRYSMAAGDSFTTQFLVGNKSTVKRGDKPTPMLPTPTFDIGLDVLVKRVTGNGEAAIQFSITTAKIAASQKKVPGDVRKLFEKQLAQLVNQSGRCVLNNRGVIQAIEFQPEGQVSAQVRDLIEGIRHSINQSATPLPTEAVGKGAEWKISKNLTQGGINIQQSVTYIYIKDGKHGPSLALSLSNTAKPQNVAMPTGAQGLSAQVQKYKGHGGGDIELDLKHFLPKKSSIRLAREIDTVYASAKKQEKVSMTSSVSVEQKIK